MNEDENSGSASTVAITHRQFQSAGILLGNIEKKSMSVSLMVNGMVEVPPQSKISVSFPYGGFVRKINVLEGDYVKKGSLLAVLEDPAYLDIQESYLKSKSSLEYAGQEYERQNRLYKADVAAGKAYQKAASEYRALQASVAVTAQKLKLLGIEPESLQPGNIRSTVSILAQESGYITKVGVNQGKYINAQEELMELDDTRNIHIDLTVYEKDWEMVHAGQEVLFTLSGKKELTHRAKITLVGHEVREDRSIVVHAVPVNKKQYYMPGTYVQAKIRFDEAISNALPEEAVVRSGGEQYIFVKETGRGDSLYHFRMVRVEPGAEQDGYVQVQLPSTEKIPDSSVVMRGAFTLLSVLNNSGEED